MTSDFAALAGANRGRYRYRYRDRKGQEENVKAKAVLDRITAMLTRLGGGYCVREERSGYLAEETMPIPIPTPTPRTNTRRR